MKTRIHIIAFAICLFAALGAHAKRDKDDSAYTDTQVKILTERFVKDEKWIVDLEKREKSNNATQTARIEQLEKEIDQLSTKLADLEKREKSNTDAQTERIEQMEKEINQLSTKLADLQKWEEDKWKVGKDELSKAQKTAQVGNAKGIIALGILIPIAALVLLFAGFFFWPRTRGETPAPPPSGTRPKCPGCGWEHDPGDTICKNPSCKVQF